MQFIHDHIIAGIVGAVVLLMLVSVHHRGQVASTEAGLYYANRAQSLSLIAMIERDFPNIGAGVGPGADMILEYTWTSATRRFEFLATVDTTAGAPVERIRYEAVATQNPVCQNAGVPCFEVRRLVWNGSAFVVSGRSQATVTEFEIALGPSGGGLDSVREVGVRFAALSPMGEEGVVRRTTWETRYRPFNLTLQP